MALTGTKVEADRLPQIYASARVNNVSTVRKPDAAKITEKEAEGKTALWSIECELRLLEDQPYRTVRQRAFFHPSFFATDEGLDFASLDSSLKFALRNTLKGEHNKPSFFEALGIDLEALDKACVGRSDDEIGEAIRQAIVDAQGNTFGVVCSQRFERVDDINEEGNPITTRLATGNYDVDGGYGKSAFFGQSRVEGLEKREADQYDAIAKGVEVKRPIRLAWDHETGIELDFQG